MKVILRYSLALALLLVGSLSLSAQAQTKAACSANSSKTMCCKPAQCTPEMCEAMVAAGLCTKEEAEACNAKYKASQSKVASVKLERATIVSESVAEVTNKHEAEPVKANKCAASCSKSKAKCKPLKN